MTPRFAITLNVLALYAIAAILLAAFYFQIARGELPCPLCLLQRVALTALAFGPILMVRHGPRPYHFETAAVWLIIAVTLLNAGSVLLECGFGSCPADPMHYELLQTFG
jgi:disulfide bond formation protein DsbB